MRERWASDRDLVVPAALVVVASAVAAIAALRLDWRLVVPLGAALPLTLWVVLVDAHRPRRAVPYGSAPRGLGVLTSETALVWTWVALLLLPGVNVLSQTSRRYGGQAASGDLSGDNVLMLVGTLAALLLVGLALQRGWPGRPTALSWVFLAFSLLGLASTVWSRLPLYTFGRGVQYVAIAALTMYTASRCAVDPGLFPRLRDRITRPYVLAVVALAVWGLATHGFADRFQWPGTHPNGVASIMAIAVLLVLATPRRARVLAPVPWVLPILLLVPLVVQTGARGYTLTMVGALLVGGVVVGVRDARWLAVLTAAGLVGLAGGIAFFREEIVSFLHRGQSTDAVLSLNGRVEAWQYALTHPVGSEVWGVGLGANQGTSGASWNPFNSHSAWIDTLQTLGVIGVALLATFVLGALALSVIRRFPFGALFTIFALVASTTSATLALPDRMPALLGLVIAGLAAAPYPVERVPLLPPRASVAPTPDTPRELVGAR